MADNAAKQALSAFESCAKGDFGGAARLWTLAAEEQSPVTQCAIVTFANGAVGSLLAGEPSCAAKDLLDRAEAEAGALTNPAMLRQPLRASSSGHHFRLAARHVEAFANASSERAGRLRHLTKALIQMHRELASGGPQASDTIAGLRHALSLCFGSDCPEVRLMDASDDAEIRDCYAHRAERLKTQIEMSRGNGRADEELLVSALGLLTPRMLDVSRATTGGSL